MLPYALRFSLIEKLLPDNDLALDFGRDGAGFAEALRGEHDFAAPLQRAESLRKARTRLCARCRHGGASFG